MEWFVALSIDDTLPPIVGTPAKVRGPVVSLVPRPTTGLLADIRDYEWIACFAIFGVGASLFATLVGK